MKRWLPVGRASVAFAECAGSDALATGTLPVLAGKAGMFRVSIVHWPTIFSFVISITSA